MKRYFLNADEALMALIDADIESDETNFGSYSSVTESTFIL